MYLSKCNMLYSSAMIFSCLTSQAGEQAKAIQPIQSPASAMIHLSNIIYNHKSPYSETELKDISDFIRPYKDYINIHIASANGCNKNNLAIAIQQKQPAMVELLLKHGARLTSVAALGTNEIDAIRLCPPNNLDMFITLLAADANVSTTINRQDSNRETVLHDVLLRAIAEEINIETIKQKTCWLMWYGANPNLADSYGSTALTIVEEDESFEADQQDLLDILHQDGKETSYYQKFVSNLLCTMTKGVNVATYTNHRAMYVPSQHHQRPLSDATYEEKEALRARLRATNGQVTDTIVRKLI